VNACFGGGMAHVEEDARGAALDELATTHGLNAFPRR
jgi:hypothetical protein